ncbi:replicative DNA helicase [Paenibacillus glucanolyticus]|uniref:Replicative DNA helicase n=1 Tax=Paenibacillus glucanolyticus TaxID=59843 RepID=A0A163HZQ7_9BACL|nr:replicative DNA helicase [Paenibacillus glucanolyticus]KZS45728.1 replicative DNA helicase [Paenibacillus glucanolyticus]
MQNSLVPGIELPYSTEVEQAALGALLLSPSEVLEQAGRLTTDVFYDRAHRLIYEAIAELAESQEPIDLVTVAAVLNDKGELTDIGGVAYLSSLAGGVPTTANAGYYFKQLEDMAIRRQFIETSLLQIQQAAAGKEVSQLLASAQKSQTKLADRVAPEQDFKPIKDVLMRFVEDTETKAYNVKHGIINGLQTGFTDLDGITGGLQRSDLVIVAARPSVGKTAFALNVTQNVAKSTDEAVALFSLEMSDGQFAQRLVSSEGQINASTIKNGDIHDSDWIRMADAVGILGETNIFLDDSSGITIQDICAKCRRLKKQTGGLALVMIDYLQLIEVAGRGKSGENRQQEVSYISRTLKQLAKELDVPIVALSQLSRGVEQRQDKRPMMSDLRESGSIEQDADIVAFLYRDDYYDKESEKKNIIEIIIAKQRNGPVGTVELVFLKQFNKFVNYDRIHTDPGPKPPYPPKQNKVVNMEKRQWA